MLETYISSIRSRALRKQRGFSILPYALYSCMCVCANIVSSSAQNPSTYICEEIISISAHISAHIRNLDLLATYYTRECFVHGDKKRLAVKLDDISYALINIIFATNNYRICSWTKKIISNRTVNLFYEPERIHFKDLSDTIRLKNVFFEFISIFIL